MSDGYTFVRVADDDKRLVAEANLLADVFPGSDRYNYDYLKWQYFKNPDGPIVGFDAYNAGTIAAHYVALPIDAVVFNKPSKGLLSLNTATRPEHQGKGLFSRLASETYNLARDLGYEFVVGVANANSTPGFVRKLGFQLVAPLDASVGFGVVKARPISDVAFQRRWSTTSHAWRLANPAGKYFCSKGLIFSRTHNRFIRMQLTLSNSDADSTRNDSGVPPVNAWIGLHPRSYWQGLAIPVPRRIRPSPLNFIFLDLTGKARKLDPRAVIVDALAFDAY